jgi:hypothetical protein
MLLSASAGAQKPSADDVNKANNPLTPAITVNFQNQAQLSRHGNGASREYC